MTQILESSKGQQGGGVDADLAAIRRTAMDYIEGFYDGDAARMEGSLHPHLSKRIVVRGGREWSPGDRLDEMTAMSLVQATPHKPVPPDERRTDITVLDHFENSASVRVDAKDWIDYMHLARWNGEWRIVNVLWELRPGVKW